MCLLFSLSKYVIIPLLTEWLEGKDLIRFDVSLTNREERGYYYTVVECHRKPFQTRIFSTFSFSQQSHLMFRFAKARGYNLNDYKLVIVPKTLTSFKKEIRRKDRELKIKFAYVKVIKNVEVSVLTAKQAQLVSRLLQCLPHIESLKSNGCNIFEKVGQYCKCLTHLDVGHVLNAALHLEEVFRHCKILTKFTWENDNMNCDQVYCAMIVHGQALQTINLSAKYNGYMTLFAMHGARDRLKRILVGFPDNKSLNSFLWYRGASLVKIDIPHSSENERIELSGVRGIKIACPHLTIVSLWNASNYACLEVLHNNKILKSFAANPFNMYKREYSNDCVVALANISTLSKLFFPIPWNISWESLKFQWNNLVVLIITCTEHSPALLKHCPKLRELIILPSIFQWIDVLIPELTHIQVLEIQTSSRTIISWSALESVAKHCSSLTDFYCTCFSDSTMYASQFKVHPNRSLPIV